MYDQYSSRKQRIFLVLLSLMLSMIVNPCSSFGFLFGGRRHDIRIAARSPPASSFIFMTNDDQSSSSTTTTTTSGIIEEEENSNIVNGNDNIVSDLEEINTAITAATTVNNEEGKGEQQQMKPNIDVDDIINEMNNDNDEQQILESDISPLAPPLTFQKYITMQNKRVPVLIRYSGESGMKPYFLTAAQKIKEKHPDVILNKVVLAKEEKGGGGVGEVGDNVASNPTFEVLVDDKVVIRGPSKGRNKSSNAMSVFVSSEELDLAISRARKRRRPATVYGEDGKNGVVRLDTLRKTKANSHQHSRD